MEMYQTRSEGLFREEKRERLKDLGRRQRLAISTECAFVSIPPVSIHSKQKQDHARPRRGGWFSLAVVRVGYLLILVVLLLSSNSRPSLPFLSLRVLTPPLLRHTKNKIRLLYSPSVHPSFFVILLPSHLGKYVGGIDSLSLKWHNSHARRRGGVQNNLRKVQRVL